MNLLLPYQKETQHLFNKQELCTILLATPAELYQRMSAYKIINNSTQNNDTYIQEKIGVINEIFEKKKLYTSSSGLLIENYSEKEMLEYKTLKCMLNSVEKAPLLKIINKWKVNSLNSNNGLLMQNNFKSLVYLTAIVGNETFPNFLSIPAYEKKPLQGKGIFALKENKAIEVSSNIFDSENSDKKSIMKNSFQKKVLFEIKMNEEYPDPTDKRGNILKSIIYLYNTLYKGAEYSYNIENTMNIIKPLKNKTLEKTVKEIPVDAFPLDLPERIGNIYGRKDSDLRVMLVEKSNGISADVENNKEKRQLNFIEYSIINATLMDMTRMEKYSQLKKGIESISDRFETIEMGKKVRSKFSW